MKNRFKFSPAAVISISILIAAVMLISSYIELNQSKKEIFSLLYDHSSTLLESVIQSSANTLNSSYEIENIIAERLLDNARMIKRLEDFHPLNKSELIQIAKENNLFRVNIFDKNGDRILSNRIPEPGHIHGEEVINRYKELKPIFDKEVSEMVIGLKNAEFSNEERFAVAISRSNQKGAIVVNMDAKDFLEFRKKIGIGITLRQMSDHHGIEYILFQDTIGVLAASEKIDTVESLLGDPFLSQTLNSDSVFSRVARFKDHDVYEVVKRFELNSEFFGIFRLGVSLEDVKTVESRMIRRLIIISMILAAITVIVLSIIFTTQNLKTISSEYEKFKTLTSAVLENMSEAVIVLDKNFTITLFNKSAELLFNAKAKNVLGNDIESISNAALGFIKNNISGNVQNFQSEILLQDELKYFQFTLTTLADPDTKQIKHSVVIKDLTETKRLEENAKRNEKLSAMGELASGVAHEIRNPINAIGMIAQRLNKEFVPTENTSEYSQITQLLRDEVKRINKIITQFLSYAKPIEISKTEIEISDYLKDIFRLFETQAKQKSVNLILSGNENFKVNIDADLIKQSLLNIITNAFDAVGETGKIIISYSKLKKDFVIEISDNGPGIEPGLVGKIFDLYFTTKKDGNGLGLSITQKIISQHKGTISVQSNINKGTTFKILLPIQ